MLIIPIIFLLAISFSLLAAPDRAEAQYGCSDYGSFAYEDYSGSCVCMAGYVFKDDYLGTRCVSGDSVCSDKYGYGSDYDSLSGSCECRYGYVFGKNSIGQTECISDDQACKNQLGYHARSTYGDKCECSYGYVIDGGECVDGNSLCRQRHGSYVSYDSLDNSCECDDGYTLDDDNECVKKQNNVYFKLLDINETDDSILVKSDYSGQKYILEHGIGCSLYIEIYLNRNLVINLGTDFDVDNRDTIVLPDQSATCSITYHERTFDDSFPDEEEVYDAPSYYPETYTQEEPEIDSSEDYVDDEEGSVVEEETTEEVPVVIGEVESRNKRGGFIGFLKRLFGRK